MLTYAGRPLARGVDPSTAIEACILGPLANGRDVQIRALSQLIAAVRGNEC
jgi:hypothetical protein